MKIDHLGYAVKEINKAKSVFEKLGYLFEETITDNDRNIYIAFGEMNGYRIELVAPISYGSPVDNYLTNVGATPYHICYVSENIDEDIKTLEKNRFKVIIPLAPAIAFGGKKVVFMYSLTIGIIEIAES